MIASIIFGILVFGYILQPAAPIAYNMVTVYLPTMFMTGIAHMPYRARLVDDAGGFDCAAYAQARRR